MCFSRLDRQIQAKIRLRLCLTFVCCAVIVVFEVPPTGIVERKTPGSEVVSSQDFCVYLSVVSHIVQSIAKAKDLQVGDALHSGVHASSYEVSNAEGARDRLLIVYPSKLSQGDASSLSQNDPNVTMMNRWQRVQDEGLMPGVEIELAGSFEHQVWAVLPYIRGVTLDVLAMRLRAEGKQLPSPVILHIIRSVLRLLAWGRTVALHKSLVPLVHGDLNLEHIRLTEKGNVLVTGWLANRIPNDHKNLTKVDWDLNGLGACAYELSRLCEENDAGIACRGKLRKWASRCFDSSMGLLLDVTAHEQELDEMITSLGNLGVDGQRFSAEWFAQNVESAQDTEGNRTANTIQFVEESERTNAVTDLRSVTSEEHEIASPLEETVKSDVDVSSSVHDDETRRIEVKEFGSWKRMRKELITRSLIREEIAALVFDNDEEGYKDIDLVLEEQGLDNGTLARVLSEISHIPTWSAANAKGWRVSRDSVEAIPESFAYGANTLVFENEVGQLAVLFLDPFNESSRRQLLTFLASKYGDALDVERIQYFLGTRAEIHAQIRSAYAPLNGDRRTQNRSLRVLVIAGFDLSVHQELLQRLGSEGFSVELQMDFEQGLETLEHNAPSLVMCDSAASGVDWARLLAIVNNDNREAPLPVFAINFDGEAHEEANLIDLGCEDVFGPLDNAQVVTRKVFRSLRIRTRLSSS